MKNNRSEYICKNGLKIIHIYKPKFKESYVGIGVNYGSRDINFYAENEKYKSPKGLAHFIEHKLFQMPEGDAFSQFSQHHASANAYTDTEKTIYYFTTTMELYPPLELLLKMYFTPYFPKEDVEKEKGIILSEIKMHEDDIQSKFFYQTLKALYPNSSIATDATGTVQGVKKTTSDDLFKAYQEFYTTDNSYMVVVSSEPKEKIFLFIEETLASLKCLRGLPRRIEKVSYKVTAPVLKYFAKTEQISACLAIRLAENNSNSFLCNSIIGILDSLFSPMAKYYKTLYKQNAFYADIEYSIVSLRDTSYCLISTTSNHPELFLELIENKLRNLKIQDIDDNITELYQKHLKAKSILIEDEISTLGEESLIYALEGSNYTNVIVEGLSLNKESLCAYLPLFHNATYVKAICKKSEK